MSRHSFHLARPRLWLALSLAVLFPLMARPSSTTCTISLKRGDTLAGTVSHATEKGLQLHYRSTSGGHVRTVALDSVKAVRFDKEREIMEPGLAAYRSRRWETAAQAFAKVATDFEYLRFLEREQGGNFASKARFYQIDCLRRLGQAKEFATALQTPTGRTLDETLPNSLQLRASLFPLWQELAAQRWDRLKSKLSPFANGQGNYAHHPVTIRPQLHYFRAKLAQQAGDTGPALEDYYAAMTLDHGADTALLRSSMLGVLMIRSEQSGAEADPATHSDLYALAVMLEATGSVPEVYRKYLRKPGPP